MQCITEFSFLNDYHIFLRFASGHSGTIDLRPFLGKGIAKSLLEPENFKTLHIEPGGGLAFANGYDFCPNFLYEQVKQVEKV